jgi:hypothetical protein
MSGGMDRQITADEFHRAIEGLREYVGERCDGIDKRLDKVNGRLDRHGSAIERIDPVVARHDERLGDHERRIGAAMRTTLPPDLSELLELARDAKGAVRVTRWLWVIGVAVVPLVLWWMSLQAKP